MHEMINLLKTRRSPKAATMNASAPSAEELQDILTIAARVPDHGRVVPFHFTVFQGEERERVGKVIADIFVKENPSAPADKIEIERNRFLRAPLVIAVNYRKRRGKHPLWEQMMTAGAACQNLLLAVHAHGYVGQWLSEWYAYNDEFRSYLGLDDRDTIAGFIHIGSAPDEAPAERERSDLAEIVTYWQDGKPLKKGDDGYDNKKFNYPRLGI